MKTIIVSLVGVVFLGVASALLAEEKIVIPQAPTSTVTNTPSVTTNEWKQVIFGNFDTNKVWCTMSKYNNKKCCELGDLARLPVRPITRLERMCDSFTYEGALEGTLGEHINTLGEDSLTGGRGISFLGGRANWQLRWKHPLKDNATADINGVFAGVFVKWQLP